MATTMAPLQPGTEATARSAAFAIFGRDIPGIGSEEYRGSWRTTLHVIAEEWMGEGRFGQHAARTAAALADGLALKPLIDRCRQFGITTNDLRRHAGQLSES